MTRAAADASRAFRPARGRSSWLDAAREAEWLDEVEAITKSAGDGRARESLVYEDALADEARQQKTLEEAERSVRAWSERRGVPLQKLRRGTRALR